MNYHDQKMRWTYRNTGQLVRHYKVSTAVYTVISTTGDRTSDHRAETILLSHSPYRTCDAKLTSYDNCAANWPECVLQVTSVHFAEDTVTSMTSLFGMTSMRYGLWLCCRDSALQYEAVGSVSSGGYHGYILLMWPNKVETAVQCFRMPYVSVPRIFRTWYFNTQYKSSA